jgi:hypothetical protein
MPRTKLFISYNHRDREWLDRLRLHLAILERRDLVHVWSDTRIEAGDRWQNEIEKALTESRVAVLLISPDFLASEYIWNYEMPRILAHNKNGMLVFPLIARPCAWRIATELAELQARPADGRALSLGSEAELDRDLAELVYELSDRLEQLPVAIASEEIDLVRRQRAKTRSASIRNANQGVVGETKGGRIGTGGILDAGQSWTGLYGATNRHLRLPIREHRGSQFTALMEYLDDGTVTEIQGRIVGFDEIRNDRTFSSILSRIPDCDAGIIFRETRVAEKGNRAVDLNGEYRAVIAGPHIAGTWISNGRVVGEFELKRDVGSMA